jgi:hypothetical protein
VLEALELPSRPLCCVECGCVCLEGCRGWRAYLAGEDEVVVYCPACAVREFGD